MIIKHKNLKVKPFKQITIIQTKEDNGFIKHYTNVDSNLVCIICGEEVRSFEAIIKAIITVGSDKKIEKIEASDIMLIKPTKCSKCGNPEFIKTFTANKNSPFTANEDLYGQRIN